MSIRILRSLIAAALLSAGLAQAAVKVGDVEFAQQQTVQQRALELNGAGLRTRLGFKVYAMGLYLRAQLAERGHVAALDRMSGEDERLLRQREQAPGERVEERPRIGLAVAGAAAAHVEGVAAEEPVAPQVAQAAGRVARRAQHAHDLVAEHQARAVRDAHRFATAALRQCRRLADHQLGARAVAQRAAVGRVHPMDMGAQHVAQAQAALGEEGQDELGLAGRRVDDDRLLLVEVGEQVADEAGVGAVQGMEVHGGTRPHARAGSVFRRPCAGR